MANQSESFHYTYSAKDQEDKMEQLRKLNRIPVQKVQALSLVVVLIGMALVVMTLPMYNRVLNKE